MTPSRGREHHQTHCLLKRFDIECKTINSVVVITETSALSNIWIQLEMTFFKKELTLVEGELSVLKEIFTERDDTQRDD